jgi:uncharacterized cupin superfamily protein
VSVTIILNNATQADLGDFVPKATSLSGDVAEASVDTWSGEVSGTLETGIWEATPGEFGARRDGFHEICYLLTGSATLIEDSGDTVEVTAGDLFITPAGWVGRWIVHETVRKVFVIATTP